MGRLISRATREGIIKNDVQNFLKRTTLDYAKFLETTPTFTTYYSKHTVDSTEDETDLACGPLIWWAAFRNPSRRQTAAGTRRAVIRTGSNPLLP